MQKISPFLWFDDNAEEAANFYTSIFKNSRIVDVGRYGDVGPGPKGSAMSVTFELEGITFLALNGGPHYKLSEAFSLFVDCETQAEVDKLWDTLIADGGSASRCGWLKDRYGLSWQIVPSVLTRLLHHPDASTRNRVMQAMLKMGKLDIATLQRAADEV